MADHVYPVMEIDGMDLALPGDASLLLGLVSWVLAESSSRRLDSAPRAGL
jgi:hypothetical protein